MPELHNGRDSHDKQDKHDKHDNGNARTLRLEGLQTELMGVKPKKLPILLPQQKTPARGKARKSTVNKNSPVRAEVV